MVDPASHPRPAVGPFAAGSSRLDLIALAGRDDAGLRLLGPEEQRAEFHQARCQSLVAAAREFFFEHEGTSSLIFQKVRDSDLVPDFLEYACCWLAEDRLCGLALSGVTSDAGTHEQMDQQEAAFREHTAEVAEALDRKYPKSPAAFVNFLDFGSWPAPPSYPPGSPEGLSTEYPRLVGADADGGTAARIVPHHCGPVVVRCARRDLSPDIPSGSTHSRQLTRRFFAGDEFFVVYDVKIERYVRTIESVHMDEGLIYIACGEAEDVGRRLCDARRARVAAESRAEIEAWRESLRHAEEARTARIRRLSEIL